MWKSNSLFQISDSSLNNGNQIYDFIDCLSLQQQTNEHGDICKWNVLIEEEAHIVDFISRTPWAFIRFPPLKNILKEWVKDQ